MALIGLFCANHPNADGNGEPAALLRVGGITLLERNIRLALRAGAVRVVVLADVMGPQLSAELAMLRRRYPMLDVVGEAEHLASRVENADRVLMIEEGFVVDPRLVAEAVACSGRESAADEAGANTPDAGAASDRGPEAVISVWLAGPSVPDQAVRLTAQYFSAAVSVLPGQIVRRVAKGLGDWDFEQTVLRAAMVDLPVLYLDAARCGGFDPSLGRDLPLVWHAVTRQEMAAKVDMSLAGLADASRADAPTRWIYAPLARLALLHGDRLRLGAVPVAWGGAVLGLLAVCAFALGWLWAGVACAILMGFAFEMAHRIEKLRLDPAVPRRVRQITPRLAEAGWYAGLCAAFVGTEGMAAVAVALLLLVCRLSADLHRHYFRRLFQSSLEEGAGLPRLIGLAGSGPQTNMWLLLLCGVAGAWYGGIWALAGYSAVTYALVLAVFILRLKQLVRGQTPLGSGQEEGGSSSVGNSG